MTLIDLINEVKQSRNKVIPTAYILNRLIEIEKRDMRFRVDKQKQKHCLRNDYRGFESR